MRRMLRRRSWVHRCRADRSISGGGSVLRYEILGPIRLMDDGVAAQISARKVGIVLAALLVRSDQVVGTCQLMTEIWGEDPPRRASAGLHVYVSQLRRFLNRDGREVSRIVT